MATLNCPNCGSTAMPGATTCSNCGASLTPLPDDPTPDSPPAAGPDAEASGPTFSRPAMPGLSFSPAALSKRWGVEQSPVLIVALVLAAVALLAGTVAVISLLLADVDEFDQKDDAHVLFYLAIPLALGAAALMAHLRLKAGAPESKPAIHDQRIAYGLFGLSVVFALLSLFKGFDESLSAEAAWYDYSQLFAFFALGMAIISRPIPRALGSIDASMIGLIAVGIAVVFGVIGGIQARSGSFSTYAMGVTMEDGALIAATLALAWFLGMRRASE
jgi:hypothetical protein